MSELPATMRAAVLHGQLDLTIEERQLPTVGPRDVLLEVSHCGVCGTDLHYVLEGWGVASDRVEGHEWSGRVDCRRRCGRAMEARRRGGRRALAALRHLRVLPVAPAVAVHRQRAVRRRRAQQLRGRVRRVRARARRQHRAGAAGGLAPGGRARRAAGGRVARPHPRRRAGGSAAADHRRGSHRNAVDRGRTCPRRDRHRGERAAPEAAGARREARGGDGRAQRAQRARLSRHDGRRALRRRVGVFGPPRCHGSCARAAEAGGNPRIGRGRHRVPTPEHVPDPA